MWTALITSNKDRIKDKIDQIAKEVENSAIDVNEFGLLSGASGKALFLAYYGKYSNDEKYIEKANALLSDVLTIINKSQNFNPLFSNGITGVLWVVHHLFENNFIEVDFNQMFRDTNEYLSEQLIKMYDVTNDYDFFHGSIGIANYLLKDTKYKDVHNVFIKKLKSKGVYDNNSNTIKWSSTIMNSNNEREQVINLSLSHGISSIIAYLNKYMLLYGKTNDLSMLLGQSINFIKSNEQDQSIYKSFFPNWISDDIANKNSGLRWCYGDLGIAYTLYKSSFILSDRDLKAYSEQILLKTCERKDIVKENVVDSGLCHGSLGIAHIYNRLFNQTGDKTFKNTAEYWYQAGVNSAIKENGIAGFMSYNGVSGWSKDLSFLTGVCGIGLSLLSSISEIEPKWDECLLLS